MLDTVNPSQIVARAQALAPLIQAEADATEREGRVTAPVMAALHEAGLFRMLLPQSLAGAELPLPTFVQAIEAIARADASTAWCVGQGCGCSFAAASLDPAAAHKIFGAHDAVLAWGPSTKKARAVAVDGGYLVSGQWMYASGGRNAQWFAGHCPVFDRDGAPVLGANGRQFERTCLFPKALASITDVWQVMGLRGTGSDSYSVTDLFVPADHAFTRDHEADRREDGALYRFSILNVYGAAFSGVALGVAGAMLDAFIDLAQKKTPNSGTQLLRDSAAVQQQVGFNMARLRGARAYLLKTLEDAHEDILRAGRSTMEQKLAMRMAATYTIHQAREVADFAYHAAGASAIFASNPFERRFRDMNVVTQQVQAHMTNFESVGQALMGLTPAR
ncbi:MAG: acyl-CoA dehydrogenase [Hyphomicrobiales bacterium]|nr:acyl-CoA dehydrogenase [Hyphomicrobiales bacterium]